jgi:hypothetical protein
MKNLIENDTYYVTEKWLVKEWMFSQTELFGTLRTKEDGSFWK